LLFKCNLHRYTADESQANCALSGEPVQVFWNPEEDEWHYRSAVRLENPVGAVPAGAIVLVSAVPKGEGEGMLAAVAEGRAVADDLAEAAATIEAVAPPEEEAGGSLEAGGGNKRKAAEEEEEAAEDAEVGLCTLNQVYP
jgi:hypothetical protein